MEEETDDHYDEKRAEMSERNRDDKEERFMNEIRPYVYGGALVLLFGAALVYAVVTGDPLYKACIEAGSSPLSCV